MNHYRKGLLLVILAYTTWGLVPGYWTLLASVRSEEVLAHRIVWSAFFLGTLLLIQGKFKKSISLISDFSTLKILIPSTFLIAGNWLLYVWAIGHGYFMESGLGYYLCPLCSIALGRIILKERLSSTQKTAIFFVAFGVVSKLIISGHLPVIAIGLAISFATYTLLRKISNLDPMGALFVETLLAGVPAFCYILSLWFTNNGSFLHQGLKIDLLLAASGVVTALPLLWLVTGAPHIPLQLTGVLQFIAPTLTMVVGALMGDSIPTEELPSYLLIWLGIGIYLLPAVNIPKIKYMKLPLKYLGTR